MRLIQVVQLPDAHVTCRVVKVYRNAEWNEYVCKLFVSGGHYEPADYHTDDKQDAIDTARLMCGAVWTVSFSYCGKAEFTSVQAVDKEDAEKRAKVRYPSGVGFFAFTESSKQGSMK